MTRGTSTGPMTPDELAQALRAAANRPLRPATPPAMGIRYKTIPAAATRAAEPARRPAWMNALAATPSDALEQLSPTSRTHQIPKTRTHTTTAATAPAIPIGRPVPAPRQPAGSGEGEAGRGWDSIEAAQAAADDLRRRADRVTDPEEAADLRQQAAETGAGMPVLRRHDAYACLRCGSRYGYDVPDHACGLLTPVTVTITARTSTPKQAVLGSYDTFGCWTCRATAGSGDAGHSCGPLTPVTVTITRRAEQVNA